LLVSACSTPVVPQAGPPQTTTTLPPVPTTTAPPDRPITPPVAPTPTTTIPTGQPVTPPDTPTIPGLTDEVIRIAVIADVETGGFADNRSRSVWGAVEAWATEVNFISGLAGRDGGLAGRDVEVIFIDTGLFNHEAAINRVCREDIFAVVGSDAFFDNEGISRLGEPDCPVLNFPAVANTPQHQSNPNTFLSNPLPPEMFQAGPLRVLEEANPEAADAAALLTVSDLSQVVINGEKLRESALFSGFSIVADPEIALISLLCAPEVPYGELVEMGAKSILWPSYGAWLIQLLNSRGLASETGDDEPGTTIPEDDNSDDPSQLEDSEPEEDSQDGQTAEPDATTPGSDIRQELQQPDEESEEQSDQPQLPNQPGTEPTPPVTAERPDPAAPAAESLLCPPTSTETSPPDLPSDNTAEPDEVALPVELELDFTLCDHTCHSPLTTDLLTEEFEAGRVSDPNLMIWTHLQPLEEAETNREIIFYSIFTQLVNTTIDGQPFTPDLQGLAAWSAGRLFEEAVKIAVENLEAESTTSGDDSAPPPLTQEAVKEAMSSITEWTSGGLHEPTNPAEKIPTPCFVLLSWNPQQAIWQRQHPSAPGEWDCQPDNLYTLQLTGGLGLGTETSILFP